MEAKELKTKLKMILSGLLGVEIEDINDDDDFLADLQMETTTLFDFQEKLSSEGFNTAKLDFNEISSIEELVDALEGASPNTGDDTQN